MALQTALFSSLTGITNNSKLLAVSGNNIANVNTTAYKKSRITFETEISQRLSTGSAPTGQLGGTNPSQMGLGTRLSSITRDFSTGSLQPTGVNTDMAVEGNGFFIVNIDGNTRYTRTGNFVLDRDFNLVSASGGLVQGFGVDEDFNVVDGLLQNLSIPIGVTTIAEATQNVKFAGNFNAGGDVATVGSISTSEVLYSDALATTPIVGTDALSTVFDVDGNALFAAGDVITVSGVTKGGAAIGERTFEIGAANTTNSSDFGTTVDDYMAFLDDIFGIDTTLTSATSTPGVTLVGGQILVESNIGEDNGILFEASSIKNNNAVSFGFTNTQDANGESTRTTFVAFDSLGDEVTIDLRFVLESKTSTGATWRYFADSTDDTDLDLALGTGVISFDTEGNLLTVSNPSISVDRANTGAVTPLNINLQFNDPFATVTSLASSSGQSQIAAISQDGSQIGTLEDFSVGEDGTISGVFSNGLLRNLGRVPLAVFANNNGLEEFGGSLYRPTVNSGIATVVSPGQGGSGRVIGRSLELSNVELAEEFINLISASTGFSANSRVLTTSDELIQELLASVR
ncbi:MAG: flagellar hook-basal body complex protein [Phycisphaerales bacterium]